MGSSESAVHARGSGDWRCLMPRQTTEVCAAGEPKHDAAADRGSGGPKRRLAETRCRRPRIDPGSTSNHPRIGRRSNELEVFNGFGFRGSRNTKLVWEVFNGIGFGFGRSKKTRVSLMTLPIQGRIRPPHKRNNNSVPNLKKDEISQVSRPSNGFESKC